MVTLPAACSGGVAAGVLPAACAAAAAVPRGRKRRMKADWAHGIGGLRPARGTTDPSWLAGKDESGPSWEVFLNLAEPPGLRQRMHACSGSAQGPLCCGTDSMMMGGDLPRPGHACARAPPCTHWLQQARAPLPPWSLRSRRRRAHGPGRPVRQSKAPAPGWRPRAGSSDPRSSCFQLAAGCALEKRTHTECVQLLGTYCPGVQDFPPFIITNKLHPASAVQRPDLTHARMCSVEIKQHILISASIFYNVPECITLQSLREQSLFALLRLLR